MKTEAEDPREGFVEQCPHDRDKDLSIIGKVIVDACSISSTLDAAQNAPNTKGCLVSQADARLGDLSSPAKRRRTDISNEDDLIHRTHLRALRGRYDVLVVRRRQLDRKIAELESAMLAIYRGNRTIRSDLENIYEGTELRPKKISEATYSATSEPCAELDDLCSQNLWTAPIYQIAACEDGMFKTTGKVEGYDFKCRATGEIKSATEAAIASSADALLKKIRRMIDLHRS